MRKILLAMLLLVPTLAFANANWIFVGSSKDHTAFFYNANSVNVNRKTDIISYLQEMQFPNMKQANGYTYNNENMLVTINCHTHEYSLTNYWTQFIGDRLIESSHDTHLTGWKPIQKGSMAEAFEHSLCMLTLIDRNGQFHKGE